MLSKKWLNFEFFKSPQSSLKDSPQMPVRTKYLTTVYDTLFIFKKMKRQLGLGATLEYIEKYMLSIELKNPRIKGLVHRHLMDVDVEQMYVEEVQK